MLYTLYEGAEFIYDTLFYMWIMFNTQNKMAAVLFTRECWLLG